MRKALVTGCSRGIGHALTLALLADGWRVHGASRTRPEIEHERFSWGPVDLDLAYQVKNLRADLRGEPLDALVHCAATYGPIGPVAEADWIDWSRALDVNLLGTFLVLKAALPLLRQSDDARALLLSGGGAFTARPCAAAYAATKAGVVALAEALAVEERGRVAVNCVAPGFVPTAIHRAVLDAGRERGGPAWEETVRALAGNDGTEMARAVDCIRHLLSDDARGLTGKSVSAAWDDWRSITAEAVPALNASRVWTRDRVTAAEPARERVA